MNGWLKILVVTLAFSGALASLAVFSFYTQADGQTLEARVVERDQTNEYRHTIQDEFNSRVRNELKEMRLVQNDMAKQVIENGATLKAIERQLRRMNKGN